MSFRAVFITFSVLIIVALVGIGVYFWYQANIKKGLEIELGVPDEISIGTPFEFTVKILNNSQSILNDAELLVELPEAVALLGSPPDKTLNTKNLGNLGAGSLTEETFKLLALGDPNTVKEIHAAVSYLPKTLGARFEQSETIAFSVTEPNISLDLSLPQKVLSGEEFEIRVSYKNISAEDMSDLKLKIEWPPTMTVKTSSPKPDSGNNIWELGDLLSGSEGLLLVKAELTGPDDSFFEIKAILEAKFLGRAYRINEQTASIAVAPSPLVLQINLEGGAEAIVYPDQELVYKISYSNNTDTGLRDVIARARLIGEMYDFATVVTNAALRSSDNTLIWNGGNTPELAVIAPGVSGAVEFRIRTKRDYPIRRLSDKNFVLKVEAEIESPTVPQFVTAKKTLSQAKLETKVGGRITVQAQGFFRDAASGILNKGPWPPKVGQPTNFTIHWIVVNYSNEASNIRVKAFLGSNVRLSGVVKSTAPSKPIWNERTQEVTWEIASMTAGKGIVNSPYEAIFQIELTPSVNQVGQAAELIRPTSIEALDDFTGAALTGGDREITTTSLDDPTVKPEEGNVQP